MPNRSVRALYVLFKDAKTYKFVEKLSGVEANVGKRMMPQFL